MMEIRPRKVVLLLLLVFAAASCPMPSAANGGVALRTSAWVAANAGKVEARVVVANTGDQPVLWVHVDLKLGERRMVSSAIPGIPAGGSKVFAFENPERYWKEGRYPYVAEIRFHDRRHVPDSTLVAGTFTVGHVPPPRLALDVSNFRVERTAEAVARVDGPGPRPAQVTFTLRLPHALSPDSEIRVISPSGQAAIETRFQVENRFDATGSYPVFCILEYEDNGIPQAVVATAESRLRTPVAAWRRWFRPGLAAGTTFLTLGWAAVAISGRTNRRTVQSRRVSSTLPPEQPAL